MMIIAESLLAEQRLKACKPPNRWACPQCLSLTKISRSLEALLPVLQVAGDVITAKQREKLIAKFMAHTAEGRIHPQRSRGNQRGLCKPCAHDRVSMPAQILTH